MKKITIIISEETAEKLFTSMNLKVEEMADKDILFDLSQMPEVKIIKGVDINTIPFMIQESNPAPVVLANKVNKIDLPKKEEPKKDSPKVENKPAEKAQPVEQPQSMFNAFNRVEEPKK